MKNEERGNLWSQKYDAKDDDQEKRDADGMLEDEIEDTFTEDGNKWNDASENTNRFVETSESMDGMTILLL